MSGSRGQPWGSQSPSWCSKNPQGQGGIRSLLEHILGMVVTACFSQRFDRGQEVVGWHRALTSGALDCWPYSWESAGSHPRLHWQLEDLGLHHWGSLDRWSCTPFWAPNPQAQHPL